MDIFQFEFKAKYMRVIFLVFSIVIYSCITGKISAQQDNPLDKTFSEYSVSMVKDYDISCKLPKKFVDLKYFELWKFRDYPSTGAALLCSPIIQSVDEECLLLYPALLPLNSEFSKAIMAINDAMFNSGYVSDDDLHRGHIYSQLRTAFGHIDEYGYYTIPDSILYFDNHVTVYSGRWVNKYFNADSVLMYSIPMKKPYRQDYIHCTGMIITKVGRPYFQLLWLFSEKGKMNEKRYFRRLRKSIQY